MMILDIIKDSLGLPKEETNFDEQLNVLILGAKELLRGSGVGEKYITDEDPLISSFIIIYVTTMFGFKSDGSLKEMPKHFELLLRQIALTKHDS